MSYQFKLDNSKWSMQKLEYFEYNAGSAYEIEYGHDMYDLPPEQWDMDKIQEQSHEIIWKVNGRNPLRENPMYAPFTYEDTREEPRKKNRRDVTMARHKKEDKADFGEIFIQKDSIFSDFKTEEDERATEPPQILVME